VLHVARGAVTFCSRPARGLKLQPESDPITSATCKKCAAVVAALRIVPISEPTLDPLDSLTEMQRQTLDKVRAEALGADSTWPGFVPHGSNEAQALSRLARIGLVVLTGRTIAYTRPSGTRCAVAGYKLAEKM
jgi:hypothetical protein